MLDESIGFQLSRTTRKISQLLASRFEPYGVTTEQFATLQRLAERDGVSQKELAARAEKDPTNMTRILDQLERKGLIARKPNAGDRRSFLVYGTEEGHRLAAALAPVERAALDSLLEGLPVETRDAFRAALDHLWKNACLQAESERE
ncbi:MAG TPA: MarR family transcriptional regulator [Paenibacillus sp.]|nr:MarR family transcriptional regulator [Paenibacillus sp.]